MPKASIAVRTIAAVLFARFQRQTATPKINLSGENNSPLVEPYTYARKDKNSGGNRLSQKQKRVRARQLASR